MPRSGRVSPRVPPIALGTTLLRSHYSHTHTRPLSPRLEGKTRIETRKLRDHVRTVGRVVLDVAGWERNCIDTPRTEDLSATWSGPGSSSFEMSQATTERSDTNSLKSSSTGQAREAPKRTHSHTVSSNAREREDRSAQRSERRDSSTQLVNTSHNWLPFLGVEVTVDRYSAVDGLRVVGVAPGSPSSTAGVRVGDVIKRLNGVMLTAKKDLRSALQLLANAPGIHPPVYPSVPAEISRTGSASVIRVHIVPTGKASLQNTSITPRRTRASSVCLSRRRAPSYTGMSNRRNCVPRYATSP